MAISTTRVLLLALVSAASATGCAVVPASAINEEFRETIVQRHTGYRLKPGDTIRIEVADRADDAAYNQLELLVLPDGKSDLFKLHDHALEGKTVAEVEQELKAKVAESELDAATAQGLDVRVQVVPADEYVYMVGQFERPNRLQLTVKMTLQEAIAGVGGMLVTGDTDYALLQRPLGDPVHPALYRIDLNDLAEDLWLLPGDRVILGRNFAGAVVHYVREFIFGIFPPIFTTAIAGSL